MTHKDKSLKSAERYSKRAAVRHKQKEAPEPIEYSAEELEGIEEDCDREMYGSDYEHLKDSGWLDR